MRTNEKVLNLLYEEITQGAHKAETKDTLDELTTALRKVGNLGPSFIHKFEKKNTKVLQKIKLPYDQSRKIFAIVQLEGLRELVHIAVPAADTIRRQEWMLFLHHYVHVNNLLHSTLEYTAEDIDNLEMHIDAAYGLLVRSIGGKERGITNYFHYLGSGHIVWMVRRYGNLWRFCNEGAEGLNSMASKRYNMFNNKGGHKSTCKGEKKVTCRPFEVLGSWLSRLSMWHIGMADVMFALESTKYIVWDPDTSTYVANNDCLSDDPYDSDWTPIHNVNADTDSEDSDISNASSVQDDYDSDDISWCRSAASLQTWDTSQQSGRMMSRRRKFQQRPLLV
jgi:hypothetical protein